MRWPRCEFAVQRVVVVCSRECWLNCCGLEAAEGSPRRQAPIALKTTEANRLGKSPFTPRTAGAISLWGQPETVPSVRLLFGLLTPGRDFRDYSGRPPKLFEGIPLIGSGVKPRQHL